MAIATKRVYEPRSDSDGIRILVDRLWPRGVRKEAAALDHWAKEIAPSPGLRKWFGHRPERFAQFEAKYLDELSTNPAVDEILGCIGRRKATLLYAARDPGINHAAVLARFLRRAQQK